jgi:hemerythrin
MNQQPCRQFDNQHSGSVSHSRQLAQSGLGYDSRYRSIVSLLDQMMELVQRQPTRNLAAELEHLLEVMTHHIDTENRFMELVEFPQAVQHGQRHQFIRFHTTVLRYRVGKRGVLAASELAHLRSLWLEHIQVQDRAFEEFLVPAYRRPESRIRINSVN